MFVLSIQQQGYCFGFVEFHSPNSMNSAIEVCPFLVKVIFSFWNISVIIRCCMLIVFILVVFFFLSISCQHIFLQLIHFIKGLMLKKSDFFCPFFIVVHSVFWCCFVFPVLVACIT